MRIWKLGFAVLLCAAFLLGIGSGEQARTERISGTEKDFIFVDLHDLILLGFAILLFQVSFCCPLLPYQF